MSKRMYELWRVDLDDSWHDMNMKWLVIKVAWLWHDRGFEAFIGKFDLYVVRT